MTNKITSLNSFKENKKTIITNPVNTNYKTNTYKPLRAHNGLYFPIINCMLLPGTPI